MISLNFAEDSAFLNNQQFLSSQVPPIQSIPLAHHLHITVMFLELRRQTLRIEKGTPGGRTTIRLIGHFRSEHIEELQKQLPQNGPRFVLDLTELMLVDVDVVRFLGACEADGAEVINCAPYIREWMNEERKV